MVLKQIIPVKQAVVMVAVVDTWCTWWTWRWVYDSIFNCCCRLSDIFALFKLQFHFGTNEKILFDQWSIDSVGGLVASVLVIAVMAAFYEGLKYYREYLFWKTYNSLQYRAVTLPDKTAVVGASSEDTTQVKWVFDFLKREKTQNWLDFQEKYAEKTYADFFNKKTELKSVQISKWIHADFIINSIIFSLINSTKCSMVGEVMHRQP